MSYAKILLTILVLWGVGFTSLFASAVRINSMDVMRSDPAFQIMETIKIRLRDGEGGVKEKSILADALFQYALTGRLPADALTIPDLSDIVDGKGLSSTRKANIYQKTLIAEALIVASFYKAPGTLMDFRNKVINQALELSIPLQHRKHTALGFLLYLKAEGKSDVYQRIFEWYISHYSSTTERAVVERVLNVFMDEPRKTLTFVELLKKTKEKYGPEAKAGKDSKIERGNGAPPAPPRPMPKKPVFSSDLAAAGTNLMRQALGGRHKTLEGDDDSDDDEPVQLTQQQIEANALAAKKKAEAQEARREAERQRVDALRAAKEKEEQAKAVAEKERQDQITRAWEVMAGNKSGLENSLIPYLRIHSRNSAILSDPDSLMHDIDVKLKENDLSYKQSPGSVGILATNYAFQKVGPLYNFEKKNSQIQFDNSEVNKKLQLFIATRLVNVVVLTYQQVREAPITLLILRDYTANPKKPRLVFVYQDDERVAKLLTDAAFQVGVLDKIRVS